MDALTSDCIVKNGAKIHHAFPDLPDEWHDVFTDMIVENNFTNQRLTDAVNHVIKTCEYPRPTIAKFLSFDKQIKLYRYDEILRINDQTGRAFKDYKAIDIGTKRPPFASVEDIANYNLKVFQPKK